MSKSQRPVPIPDDISRPFWDGAAAGQLVVQRCDSCGYYNHPPKPLCDRCNSAALSFVPVSGRGRIYSYTTNHQKRVSGFDDEMPYVNLVVELEEQEALFMISFLPGEQADRARIGAPVRVAFDPESNGVVLPQFVLSGGDADVGR